MHRVCLIFIAFLCGCSTHLPGPVSALIQQNADTSVTGIPEPPSALSAQHTRNAPAATKTISLYLDDADFQKVLTPYESIESRDARFVYNGQQLRAKMVKSRGTSTRRYRRKSFSINLEQPITVDTGQTTRSLSLLNLIALQEDDGYFRNYLAYSMFHRAGALPLYFDLVQMQINDSPEGIYLLTESVGYHAQRTLGSQFIARRNYGTGFSKGSVTYDGKPGDPTVAAYTNAYKDIYRQLDTLEDEQLFDFLSQRVNMDRYFTILAINYLIGNGDYTDDMYFYQDPQVRDRVYFDIMAWDCDETFFYPPHEGWEERNRLLPPDSLVYSSENLLDVKIAITPLLYHQYLRRFSSTLDQFNIEYFSGLLDEAYAKLLPLYEHSPSISMSVHDKHGEKRLDDLSMMLNQVQDGYTGRWRTAKYMVEQQLATSSQ